jgi:glycosyltransferase involved in cell wall biosynthesis
MMPKVSVVVPVYNVEKYLDECLESVCGQSYANLEILVVNDGSADSSLSICREWELKDSRIRVFDKPNRGQASARNLALDNATGDYITFIDSDDYYTDARTIECCVDELQRDSSLDIVQYPIVTSSKSRCAEFVTVGTQDIFNRWCLQPRTVTNYTWDKVFRREIFEALRFPEGLIFEDRYLFAEIFSNAPKIKYITQGEYFYRQHPNQTVKRKRDEYFYICQIKADSNILRYMPAECVEAYNEVFFRRLSNMMYVCLHDTHCDKYIPSISKLLGSRTPVGIKMRILLCKIFGLKMYHKLFSHKK